MLAMIKAPTACGRLDKETFSLLIPEREFPCTAFATMRVLPGCVTLQRCIDWVTEQHVLESCLKRGPESPIIQDPKKTDRPAPSKD